MYKHQRDKGGDKETLTKRVTRWIGILSSIFVVGFIAYWAFHLGRRDANKVPVIAAMDGDVRSKPENQDAEQQDYQGLEVNGVLEGNTPAPDSNISLAPKPDDLSSIAPAKTGDASSESAPAETSNANTITSPVGNTGLEEVVPKTGLTLAGPPRRPELLYVPAENAPAPTQDSAANLGEKTQLPEVSTPAPAEPAPLPAVSSGSGEDLGPRLPAGTPVIQLAANTTADATRSQWAQLQADNQDVLGDKSLYIEKAVVNGATFYRLRVQGFASSEQTRAACATLMARDVQCLSVTTQ